MSEEKEGQPVVEEKNNILKQIWIKYYSSKWRWVLAMLIDVFMLLIPDLYAMTAKLPPDNKLLQSSGVVYFERIDRRGSLTGLKTAGGEMLFTCRERVGAYHDCRMNNWPEELQRIQGKFATILWYRQPIYLFTEQNRLVEWRVNNEQLISREQTQKDFDYASKFPIGKHIFFWSLIIGLDIYNDSVR